MLDHVELIVVLLGIAILSTRNALVFLKRIENDSRVSLGFGDPVSVEDLSGAAD